MIDEIDNEDSPFVSISDEEYAEMQAKVQQDKALQSEVQQVRIEQAKLLDSNDLDFHSLYTEARGWQSKFSVIRAAYKYRLPSILAAARTGHSINPNIVTWEFSPIEDNAWGQIRALGLPFYPQFPVLDHFADFADPFRKIAIELDGKKFHDKKRDDVRDSRMRKEGWEIHRITGRIASRYLEDVFVEDTVYEIKEAVGSEYPFSIDNRSYLEMAEETLDGYLLVLRRRHYTRN